MASERPQQDPTSMHRFQDIAMEPRRMLSPIQGYVSYPLVTLEEAVRPLESIVPEVQRMVWTVKENCITPAEGLTPDESASIMLYSFEWHPKEKSFYYITNRYLRTEDRDKLKPWFLFFKLTMTALSKLPSARGVAYRGVKEDLHELYPEGKKWICWAFSSCTTSLEVVESDRFLGKTGTRTLFKIECYSGKNIHQHAFHSNEKEVLLLPGRQFVVVSCENFGNGLHIIGLKEVVPPFPLIDLPDEWVGFLANQ